MDYQEEWELLEFYDILEYAEYIWWEQARFLFSSQVNTKKIKKLKDIVEFPWDKEATSEANTRISNDDINRLKKMQEEVRKQIQ